MGNDLQIAESAMRRRRRCHLFLPFEEDAYVVRESSVSNRFRETSFRPCNYLFKGCLFRHFFFFLISSICPNLSHRRDCSPIKFLLRETRNPETFARDHLDECLKRTESSGNVLGNLLDCVPFTDIFVTNHVTES